VSPKTHRASVVRAHTAEYEEAAPQAQREKFRRPSEADLAARGITKRMLAAIERLLESGQAEITREGRKYLLRTRPTGHTRYAKKGEYGSLADVLAAMVPIFGVQATGTQPKTYTDVGQKVGGARKDIARAADVFRDNADAKTLKKLEKEDPDAARRLCQKSVLWPKPDPEALQKLEPPRAAAILCAWGLIPAKFDGHTPEQRQDFLRAVAAVRNIVEGADTAEMVIDQIGIWQALIRKVENGLKYNEYDAAMGRYKAVQTASFDEYETETLKHLVILPDFAKWLKEERKYKAMSPYALRASLKFPDLRLRLDKWIEGQLGPKTASAEEGGPVGDPEKPPKWERTVPAEYERKGGEKVSIRRPEEYLKRFGLRGVEFGNWMEHESSRVHVDRCAEALTDLADMLGLRSQDISLNGRLALAFGSRGHGAAAHYEPGKVVINLTKSGGAGALGHEWAHFLDNVIGMVEHAQTEMASDAGRQRLLPGDQRSTVLTAMEGVMKAITVGGGIRTVSHVDVPDKVAPKGQTAQWWEVAAKRLQAKYPDDPGEAASRLWNDYRGSKWHRQYGMNFLLERYGIENIPMKLRGETAFYDDARRRGDYWKSGHELFARAFETYLMEKMQAKKRSNNYLINPWKQTDTVPVYPHGEERTRINDAIDVLMAAVRDTGLLRKAFRLMVSRPDVLKAANRTTPDLLDRASTRLTQVIAQARKGEAEDTVALRKIAEAGPRRREVLKRKMATLATTLKPWIAQGMPADEKAERSAAKYLGLLQKVHDWRIAEAVAARALGGEDNQNGNDQPQPE
jgi:hypothetical protein